MSAALTLGLSPTVRMPLADGDLGIVQTIARIRKLVHQGMTDQLVNRTAIAVVRGANVPAFDFAGEVRALYEYVRRNFRFTRDIAGVETLRTAREILLIRAGDCDDLNAVLLPSLLASLGHHVRLVTISADPSAPREFSHVYCEVEMNGQWVPLDAARRDAAFGRGPQQYFRKRVWSLTDRGYRDVQGLSGYFTQASRGAALSPRAARRRLGDFDWGVDLPAIIGSATGGVANILNATRGNPYQYLPPASRGNPAGTLYAQTTPEGVVTTGIASIPNWMLYSALGLAALLVLRR